MGGKWGSARRGKVVGERRAKSSASSLLVFPTWSGFVFVYVITVTLARPNTLPDTMPDQLLYRAQGR